MFNTIMRTEFAFLKFRFVEWGLQPDTPAPQLFWVGQLGKSQARGKCIHIEALLLSYTTLR